MSRAARSEDGGSEVLPSLGDFHRGLSRSQGSVAPVTALHSYWVIGPFSLSTKIDRPQEVSYGLQSRKLFPIIASLLGQQSVLPLIAKSNKNNYKRIRGILHPSRRCHRMRSPLTQRGRAGMGFVCRADCWLLSFQYVGTCCGLGGRALTALLQVVDEGLYFLIPSQSP